VTANNTIYGTEWHNFPKPKSGFLMADVSSDFLARKINVSDFGVVYGGAQKNISCAGVTVTIIKKGLLGKVNRTIPTMLNFQTHIDAANMFNTPPVFAVYVMNRTLKWLKDFGGVDAIEKVNRSKAALLYSALDNSKVFVGTAAKEDRSIMNVPFVFNKDVVAADKADDLAKEFLEFAKARGLQQLKGHRSVGGFRASIYNAMPVEGVQALVDCLGDFEKKVLG
jgi:phosphoserine aminotransferase